MWMSRNTAPRIRALGMHRRCRCSSTQDDVNSRMSLAEKIALHNLKKTSSSPDPITIVDLSHHPIMNEIRTTSKDSSCSSSVPMHQASNLSMDTLREFQYTTFMTLPIAREMLPMKV